MCEGESVQYCSFSVCDRKDVGFHIRRCVCSFICFCWTGALSVNHSPYALPSVICSCAVVMWVLLLSILSFTMDP